MPNFRAQRIASRIIKTSLVLFVFCINAIIVWRVFFSANIPKELNALTPNEALTHAYAENGGELQFLYQDQLSLTYGKDSKGYFGVPDCVFIPEANQVQLVFRYNNSTLRHLQEDFALSAVPEKEGELFDVTLLKVVDLTPDNPDDANDPNAVQKTRFAPTSVQRDTTLLYTYYRFVFDGVSIDDGEIASVFLDVYYKEVLDYEVAPYGTLRLYDHLSTWLPYSLSSADKKALQ